MEYVAIVSIVLGFTLFITGVIEAVSQTTDRNRRNKSDKDITSATVRPRNLHLDKAKDKR